MITQEIIKEFESKRNNVSLIRMFDKQFVKKIYADGERMQNELGAYLTLRHLGITPKIVDYGEQNAEYYIIMEYVEGDTLYDIIMSDKLTSEQLNNVARSIKDIIKLTANCGLRLTDINYRNFIIAKDKTYLIDLEELEPLTTCENDYFDIITKDMAIFGAKYKDRKSDNYEVFASCLLG